MSVMPIHLFGDPVLRMKAQPVTVFDKELRTLVKDLTDTMVDAPGAGLAAPQLGVSLRVFTYHVDGELGHLVNPDLTLTDEEQDGPEGCLSLPGLRFDCKRAYGVVARASTCTATRSPSRERNCSPAAYSTRQTISTASSSSTGSTPSSARRR
ncbi:hypothetical protein GCM10009753_43820 [Streptantibioticus ferralitis]